ncbi:MAG: zinc-dependent alcohol dehydrogenase family protein [Proteobacteria bacterium]|nr:zinc-dependent alcohol dehydrogenase family protein [Pseudomonadota bacterium]MBU1711240.1 zinc-dependent alcohol dehydrogenase family protein [Pseudomonadota bacterium]
MKAMVLNKPGEALEYCDLPIPDLEPGKVLLRVQACGICRTDLHIIDGDLRDPKQQLILGHEIVGILEELGKGVTGFTRGQRLGVPWLGGTCGACGYCIAGHENLCDFPRFTGYQINGGFAEYAIADPRFCLPIPDLYSDVEAAPLLCAGLIGFRSLTMVGDAKKISLYGFGAAAHIIIQIARWQGREVFVFTRKGDSKGQNFARSLGAKWAGGSDESPPEPMDAAIIFAPAGELVPVALKAVGKGGVVVCAGIHMSQIPAFSYDLLWGERSIRSVANLTRQDGIDFFEIAQQVPVRTRVEAFPLMEANAAICKLKQGEIKGAAVLVMEK